MSSSSPTTGTSRVINWRPSGPCTTPGAARRRRHRPDVAFVAVGERHTCSTDVTDLQRPCHPRNRANNACSVGRRMILVPYLNNQLDEFLRTVERYVG